MVILLRIQIKDKKLTSESVLCSRLDLLRVLKVFTDSWQFSFNGGDGSKLGGGQKHIGTLAQAVGEVSCGSGNNGRAISNSGLVAHTQRASWHFCASTNFAVGRKISFTHQLLLIHASGRSNPEASWKLTFKFGKQFSSSCKIMKERKLVCGLKWRSVKRTNLGNGQCLSCNYQ